MHACMNVPMNYICCTHISICVYIYMYICIDIYICICLLINSSHNTSHIFDAIPVVKMAIRQNCAS